MHINYEEAQDLLHRLINEGDADEITYIFEHAFAKVVNGTASYNNGEIEFEAEPGIDWFGSESKPEPKPELTDQEKGLLYTACLVAAVESRVNGHDEQANMFHDLGDKVKGTINDRSRGSSSAEE
jgi:hypothetical protein